MWVLNFQVKALMKKANSFAGIISLIGLFLFNGLAHADILVEPNKLGMDGRVFLERYNIYWLDENDVLRRGTDSMMEVSKDYFPDKLYSDGTVLQSAKPTLKGVANEMNSLGLNYLGQEFQTYGVGDTYRIGSSLYYQKCLFQRFIPSRSENRCVRTGLFRNSTKIDEADFSSDQTIEMGIPPFDLMFVRQNKLYYFKQMGNQSQYFIYDNQTNSKPQIYRPDLFDNQQNNLLRACRQLGDSQIS